MTGMRRSDFYEYPGRKYGEEGASKKESQLDTVADVCGFWECSKVWSFIMY